MVEQVVGLRFVVDGEQKATESLKRFNAANEAAGSSILRIASKVSGAQAEFIRLNNLFEKNVIGVSALSSAHQKLAAEISKLTGVTLNQARDSLTLASASEKAARAAREQAEATARAAQAEQRRIMAIKELDGSILRQGQSVQTAVNRMKELDALQAKGAVSAAKMAQGQLEIARALAAANGYLTANGALNTQKAQAEIRAAQAAQRLAQEAKAQAAADATAAANKTRLTQSYNQLLASINPVIAAQQRTRQTVDMLRAAVAAGAITTTQAAQALLQYRAALRSLDGPISQVSQRLNQKGVIIQQAGYQMGDFIVQIQSGTNVMVALGQQATQLIGTFAAFATTTRSIMLLSGLGVIVPIITAIGAAMMRTSGESETLSQKVDKLKESSDKVAETLDLLAKEDLSEKFGNMTDEVQRLSTAMLALDDAAALTNLLGALDKLEKKADAGFWDKLSPLGRLEQLGTIFSGQEAFELENEAAFRKLGFQMSRETYLGYIEGLKIAADAGDRRAVFALFEKFINDATDSGTAVSKVSAEGYVVVDSMRQSALAVAELLAMLNGSADAASRIADIYRKITEEENLRNQQQAQRNQDVQGEIRTLQLSLKYGKDSVEVQKELNRQARARVVTEMMSAGRSAESIVAYLALVRKAQELEGNLADSERNAKSFADAQKEAASAISDGMKQIADDERSYQEFLNKRFLTNEQFTKELTNQLNINQAILQFGKDSTAVREQEASTERELFEARLRSTNLLEPQIENLMAIYDQNVLVTNQLADSEMNAKNLADALKEAASAMSSLEGFSANLDKALAVSVAKVDALKRGVDATISGNIAGMRFDLEQRMSEASDAGVDRGIIERMFGGERDKISQIEVSEMERRRLEEDAMERKKSGANDLDAVQKLKQQIARTRELMRLSADQAALQEEIWRITDALGDKSSRYSNQRIADIARENLALQDQQRIMEEAYERQQSIYDQMSSSMENAFMSIVEGTSSAKDAFRTMAYEVIKELYRVLVVQQLVGSFDATKKVGTGIVGFLGKLFTGGFAQGGAFIGGNVTAFANGGVVGSPTMFPMSGGRTGLMGEAGPEAIMPLKRTSSGKLGVVAEGGGAVVVNNNFHISANGDESVKRIVMEQAPAIAKMTQSAVIDARRRGGQMKAAFG